MNTLERADFEFDRDYREEVGWTRLAWRQIIYRQMSPLPPRMTQAGGGNRPYKIRRCRRIKIDLDILLHQVFLHQDVEVLSYLVDRNFFDPVKLSVIIFHKFRSQCLNMISRAGFHSILRLRFVEVFFKATEAQMRIGAYPTSVRFSDYDNHFGRGIRNPHRLQNSSKGHVAALFAYLVERDIVDPSIGNNGAIQFCARFTGCSSILKKLLSNPKTDPAANDNAALRIAFTNGDLKATMTLLDDERVNIFILADHQTLLIAARQNLLFVIQTIYHRRLREVSVFKQFARQVSQTTEEKNFVSCKDAGHKLIWLYEEVLQQDAASSEMLLHLLSFANLPNRINKNLKKCFSHTFSILLSKMKKDQIEWILKQPCTDDMANLLAQVFHVALEDGLTEILNPIMREGVDGQSLWIQNIHFKTALNIQEVPLQ
ncbi:hypothetical protein BC829DRAFT_412565 [Chytridium lagenaria]|nr:hypothetical protein BC829DRAFT_412565 [Chytridium lagenaria]